MDSIKTFIFDPLTNSDINCLEKFTDGTTFSGTIYNFPNCLKVGITKEPDGTEHHGQFKYLTKMDQHGSVKRIGIDGKVTYGRWCKGQFLEVISPSEYEYGILSTD